VIKEYDKANELHDKELGPYLFRVKLYAKMANIAAAAMRETESRDGTPTGARYYEELKWCADMVDLNTKAINNMLRGTQAIPRLKPIVIRPTTETTIDHSVGMATFWSQKADKYRSADKHRLGHAFRSADPDLADLCLFRARLLWPSMPVKSDTWRKQPSEWSPLGMTFMLFCTTVVSTMRRASQVLDTHPLSCPFGWLLGMNYLRGEKELLANAHIIHRWRGGWDVPYKNTASPHTSQPAIPSMPKDYTKWRAVLIFDLRPTTTGHWLQGRQGQEHKT
jgi:hypothetical protein